MVWRVKNFLFIIIPGVPIPCMYHARVIRALRVLLYARVDDERSIETFHTIKKPLYAHVRSSYFFILL